MKTINKKHLTLLFSLLVMMTSLSSCRNFFKNAKALVMEGTTTSSPGGGSNDSVTTPKLFSLAEGYCFLKSDTENFCWGTGIGNTPVNISSGFKTAALHLKGKTIDDIVSEKDGQRFCAIDSNDLAYCWGSNDDGEIGNGTTDSALTPSPIDMTGVLAGKTVKKLLLETDYSCMIASDDKVYCWGDNGDGQLGNGSTTPSTTPVAVNMTGALNGLTVKSLESAAGAVCVIASDDHVYCWGNGQFGGIANGSTNDSTVPVAISAGALGGQTVKSLKLHGNTGCVIANDNKVYCWGWSGWGRLGNGSSSNSNVPVAVDFTGVLSGKTAKSLLISGSHTCIIASDDQVYCWGYGGEGALGHNAFTNSNVPVAVDTSGVLNGKTIQKLSSTESSVCAQANDNKVYCWGYGWRGNLGNGVTGANSAIPVAVDTSGVLSGKTVADIISSNENSCVKTTDGLLYCWGEGVLGDNTTTAESAIPTALYMGGVLNGLTLSKVNTGRWTSCALASDNGIYCWGSGSEGGFGNGMTDNSYAPVSMKNTDSSDEVISDAAFKTIFDGIVYIQRTNGEVFSGSIGSPLNFTTDLGSSIITEIKGKAGFNKFLCALTDDEKLYCWGRNSFGQVGNGDTNGNDVSTPVSIDMTGALNGKTILSFAVGSNAVCAIGSDHNAYCWGKNTNGVLGDGTNTDSFSPVPVSTSGVLSGKSLSSLVMADENACAISSEGKIYCWGVNSAVFGDGGFAPSNVPVATDTTGVLNNKTIKSLKITDTNACALSTDGLVFCWGQGMNGQMGDGGTGPGSLVPVAVSTSGVLNGKTIKQIATNSYTMCAIASDDKLYCWGYGASGELGDNLASDSFSPVAVDTTGVLNGKTLTNVSISSMSVCTQDSDEEIYCWGDNSFSGEVGSGLNAISPVPVKLTL